MDSIDGGPRQTATERKNARRYQGEILAAGLAYAALVIFSTANLDHVTGPAKVFIAILPVIGAVAMAVAFVRFVSRMDELQRRTVVDAGAIALLVTICSTMALGFLENAGLQHVDMTMVWPIAVVAWGLSLPFVRRRYR